MKVAIVGSRDFDHDVKMLGTNAHTLNKNVLIMRLVHAMDKEDYVVSGGALGADYHAEKHARAFGVGRIIHTAHWDKYGKKAGHIRNRLIVNDADILFVFFTDRREAYERFVNSGRRSGSVDDVELANKKGIHVYEFDAKTDTWYGSGAAFGASDKIDFKAKLDYIRSQVNQPSAQVDEGARYPYGPGVPVRSD